jgi:hypothetical protein
MSRTNVSLTYYVSYFRKVHVRIITCHRDSRLKGNVPRDDIVFLKAQKNYISTM